MLWILAILLVWVLVGSALALFMGAMIDLRDRRG